MIRSSRSALLACLLLAGNGSATALAADPKAAIANGRAVYLRVGCWQCHGTVGQGGVAGPRIAPAPMPLEGLRAFVRNAVRAMPGYSTTLLSDADLADIHAWLASIPPAARAETIPLLRDLR